VFIDIIVTLATKVLIFILFLFTEILSTSSTPPILAMTMKYVTTQTANSRYSDQQFGGLYNATTATHLVSSTKPLTSNVNDAIQLHVLNPNLLTVHIITVL